MVLLCLYKQWHHLQVWLKVLFSQGTTYLYPSLQGYIKGPFDPPTQSGTYVHECIWKVMSLVLVNVILVIAKL